MLFFFLSPSNLVTLFSSPHTSPSRQDCVIRVRESFFLAGRVGVSEGGCCCCCCCWDTDTGILVLGLGTGRVT